MQKVLLLISLMEEEDDRFVESGIPLHFYVITNGIVTVIGENSRYFYFKQKIHLSITNMFFDKYAQCCFRIAFVGNNYVLSMQTTEV